MSGDFYGFDIYYHEISGYGDSSYNSYDYRDRKFCDLERKGYKGLAVSDVSPWELREIRRWIKKQPEHIYMSKVEEFHTTDNDGYDDNSVCLWFSDPNRLYEFDTFLKTLPKREFTIDFSETAVEAIATFEKNIMKSNRREVQRNDCVTLCFDDDVEAMAFKLRWL